MTGPGRSIPIQHVIVCCQENHSFDHYFGSYAGVPAGYGIPPGFTQPDGSGGLVEPFHFTTLTDGPSDPYHSWADIHSEWDQGKMDGFYTTNGINALGYYEASDLPYYYSLLPTYTLCAFSEHSSVLKFIEKVFGLPTLASVNSQFDTSTPTTSNDTNGAPFPPRDGNPAPSDLTQCFTFG
jgi:hypothetical protein